MFKSFLCTLMFFVFYMAWSAEVSANDNLSTYVGGRFIYNAMRINGPANKFDNMDQTTSQFGFGLSTGIRHKIKAIALRYELDYNYTMKQISYYHAVMLNLYLEGRVTGVPIVPYVMIGGGINMFDPPSPHLESGFAFNAGGGLLYEINEHWALDFSMRYMQAHIDFHVGEGITTVKNHMFNFGFQYTF